MLVSPRVKRTMRGKPIPEPEPQFKPKVIFEWKGKQIYDSPAREAKKAKKTDASKLREYVAIVLPSAHSKHLNSQRISSADGAALLQETSALHRRCEERGATTGHGKARSS